MKIKITFLANEKSTQNQTDANFFFDYEGTVHYRVRLLFTSTEIYPKCTCLLHTSSDKNRAVQMTLPPYSSYMAPCDSFLSSKLKTRVKRSTFWSTLTFQRSLNATSKLLLH
jgi:hypothetical protein